MSGPNGDLEPARPYLDVEFTNMGMRLKGTGMKVLAGVTGRLRASHLTAIMGPSGAGQQHDTVFGSSHKLDKLAMYMLELDQTAQGTLSVGHFMKQRHCPNDVPATSSIRV